MKNLAAILLASVLILPLAGLYFAFELNKTRIRQEVNEQFVSGKALKNLVILSFTKEEITRLLKWKHAGEFEYEGQMYDIAEQWTQGDTVFYSCYPDHKETKLNRERDRMIAKALGQDPVQKKQTEKLKNYFSTFFHRELFTWNPFKPSPSNLLSPISYLLSPISLPPPSPPPKISS